MINDPRYEPVTSVLPEALPALSAAEAIRAANLLVRHFCTKERANPVNGRVSKRYGRIPRRCWISRFPTTGHHKGWGRLIHDVSHYVQRRVAPGLRPHSGGHAHLEYQMAAYVVEKGWFSGTLRPKPKTKPTRSSLDQARLASLDARIKKLTTDLKRTTTYLKKAAQQRRRLAKKLGA